MDKTLEKISRCAYSTIPTLLNTFELTKKVIQDHIDGDLIECGVAAGSQIGAMGLACKKLNSNKNIYGFDSFEGIPLASENDDQQPGIKYFDCPKPFVEDKESLLVSSGATVHNIDCVLSNLKNWDLNISQFVLIKGWFQHTLPIWSKEINKISLLRLDGDLYESTKVCLENLFYLVVDGGYVIIDDYGLSGCKKATTEFLERNNLIYDIIKIEGGLGPVWFRKVLK